MLFGNAVAFSGILLFKYREMGQWMRIGYLAFAAGSWITLYFSYLPLIELSG
jgi:hypothetical protein